MSEEEQLHPNKIMHHSIDATAGNSNKYKAVVFGQIVFGFLYSFGYFDLKFVGLIIGYILPVFWIIVSYRFLKFKAIKVEKLPFPGFIKNDPGNLFVIIIDIVFLSIIWFIILSGLYDATWLRFLFTTLFPVLTLSMLRSLIIISGNGDKTE